MTPLAVFLHPALLAWGAAAAAVPIVIHLLSRRRVRPRAWAAMQWLLAAMRKHQRRLRMENWLVLALRVAALLLLGVALSRCMADDSALAALTRPRRSVVVLLDTSYSTAAKDGARSVSDRVREEADRLLASMGPDDAVVVVVSNDVRLDRPGTRPAVLLPRAVGRDGSARGRQALGAVRPTEAPAAWPDALALCSPRTALLPEDGNRLLVWITDLQARDWRPPVRPDAADPLRAALESLRREDAAIQVVDVGGGAAGPLPNLVVTEVAPAEGSDVFAGHAFSLRVGVVNYGTAPVEGATLRVHLDDAPAPLPAVRLPPLPAADARTLAARPQTVLVPVPRELAFKAAGARAVRVEAAPPDARPDADALGLDSRRALAVEVRARLRVLAWVEPSARARFDPLLLLQGLFVGEGTGDVFELEVVRDEADLRRALADPAREPGFVILGNRQPLGAEGQRELAAFVRGGGALAVFPGDRFDDASWNAAFHDAPASRLLPMAFGPRETRERREAPWTVDFSRATTHPMSEAFVRGDAKFVQGVPLRVFGRMPLVADPAPEGPPRGTPEDPVVLRFAGTAGEPGPVALAEGRSGNGRVLYCATALDDEWNPGAFALFLPVLLNDAALSMTRGAQTGRNLLVGGTLSASLPRDASSPRLSIPGRGEERPALASAASEEDRPSVKFDRVGTAGVWRLSYDRPAARGGSAPRRVEEAFGVNPDPAEGDLLRADRDAVRARAPDAGLRVVSSHEEPQASDAKASQGELTPWFLALVLLILLVEPYLAMRFGRHEGAPPAPPAPAP